MAGDIGVGLDGLDFAQDVTATTGNPVIYVCGNHEFYGQHPMSKWWQMAREKVAGSNVHLLENESVTIDGVRFLGCTLWTDFKLFGDMTQRAAMDQARDKMADYSNIRLMTGRRLRPSMCLTPRDVLSMHQASRAWLESELAEPFDGMSVVVTHHAPSAKSLMYGEPALATDAFYASHLDHLVARTDLWIHGHVHEARDYALPGGGHVVCNCRGYSDSGISAVEGFEWGKVVEL